MSRIDVLSKKIAFNQILALVLFSVSFGVLAESQMDKAKAAYFQRNYTAVESMIDSSNKPLSEEAQILAIAVAVARQNDDAQERLIKYLQQHPLNAQAHYMGGILWIKMAKNASIFSKRSLYSRYVAAMTKAAELAPDNNRYQMEAAKAYGQPSMMGGDSDKQKPIVDKLLKGGSAFAQIAYMDLLQNNQDEVGALDFVKRVTAEFKHHIEVTERAAQLLWTFDRQKEAGVLFTQTCEMAPGINEAFVKWSTACWLSAAFSLEGSGNIQQGLKATERLLKYDTVVDGDYHEVLLMRGQLLIQANQPRKAQKVYQQLLGLAPAKAIAKKAKKALRKLAKRVI